jgi:DNA-binding MarR family transcriptional regulator
MTLEPRTVLAVIAWFTEKVGYAPTLRELGLELDVAPSTIGLLLDKLEADGKITRVPGSPRTLRIVGSEAV